MAEPEPDTAKPLSAPSLPSAVGDGAGTDAPAPEISGATTTQNTGGASTDEQDRAAAWAAYYAAQEQQSAAAAPPVVDTDQTRAWGAYYASLGYPGYEKYAAGAGAGGASAAAGAPYPPYGVSPVAPPMPAYGTAPGQPPYGTAPGQPPYGAVLGQPPYGAPPAQPIMAPPPPLPPSLQPRGRQEVEYEKAGIGPQPGQEEFYRRDDNWPGRGYLVRYVGEAIHKAQETYGNIRHDLLIERRVIGRILGKGGRDLEALQLSTGTEGFIIDKYPPPGEGDDYRLLVIVGQSEQVRGPPRAPRPP